MHLNTVFGFLMLLSLGLTLWQWLTARRFPLHRRFPDTSFAPAITVLKPLKGCDAETKHCLQSWLDQNYGGPVQILFGVASADDPVCGVVRELLAEHPKADAQLVVCAESFGANAKVSTLIQLERQATHDLRVVSDADVWAPPDFLANVVASLRDQNVGLVFSFYRAANPSTLAMHWEAVAINADFWSEVLQSQSLMPLDFALGAALATTRSQLQAIGGFEALADYLADDYQLGNRIARAGKQIAICPVVVEGRESPMSWRQVWQHQLRWARTFRVCEPLLYFFTLLDNTTFWSLLWLLAQPNQLGLIGVAVCLPLRIATALDHQRRLTQACAHVPYAWLIPVKDLLAVPIWAQAFLGNDVEWRGRRYRVLRGGKLVKK